MKVQTKKKVVALLTDQLAKLKQAKSHAKYQLKQVEKRINSNKKSVAQHNQIIEHCRKMKNMASSVEEAVKNELCKIYRNIKEDRRLIKTHNHEISKATIGIKNLNDLINEISPYKKEA